jgi:type II secretory pathway pseudopilin PulG
MTMLETILIVVNVFILGYIIGQSVMAYKIRATLRKLAEDNGMDFDEMERTFLSNSNVNVIKVPNLFTETNRNSILLYNKDTGKFVAQAETFDELAENVYKFNNIKFALVTHDDQMFWFVEGKVKNDLQDLNESTSR